MKIRASHILVATKEEAENLLLDINNGVAFEDLAKIVGNSMITFRNMLEEVAAYEDELNYEDEEYTFEIKAMARYTVATDFPCIRRTNLPESITEAKYSLALSQ